MKELFRILPSESTRVEVKYYPVKTCSISKRNLRLKTSASITDSVVDH